MARPSSLAVHPRDMILALLRKSKAPVTAYGLLATLKPKGIKSAPIVYRALAELEKTGRIHKIQAIGAYVACDCLADHLHAMSVLTVCSECHGVSELHDHAVFAQLEALRNQGVRLRPHAVIELPITCETCAQ